MVTIVKFYAFAKLHTEVFYKGESMARIDMELYQRCNTYVVCEILQGELTNLSLKNLTDLRPFT